MHDLSRLGGWADLPFWQEDWPGIEAQIMNTARDAIPGSPRLLPAGHQDAQEASPHGERAIAPVPHRLGGCPDHTVPIYPPDPLRFRALELTQPEDTRVVILGQDPYHTPGKADGLAFSIPNGFPGRLDSLGNIFKEIKTDLNVKRSKTTLEDWATQGVLLLNTALSVPEGQPKAHARLGWTTLVRQVLARLDDTPRAFLLWGGPAQAFAPTTAHHLIVKSAHPSPLSAHRGFFGSRPFSKVNAWLKDRDEPEIRWGDPDGADHS